MERLSSFNPAAELDMFCFVTWALLRASLNPITINKLVKVRSDSAPPCNQSTLDKEVP